MTKPHSLTSKETTQLVPPSTTIYVSEANNLDRQIDQCRTRAITERITLVIERSTRRGVTIPIIEITPQGDVREVPVPPFRVSVRERLGVALTDPVFFPNQRAVEGYVRFSSLVAAAEAAEKSEQEQARAIKKALNQARRERQAAKITA